jgi:hypothetical protein
VDLDFCHVIRVELQIIKGSGSSYDDPSPSSSQAGRLPRKS